MPPGIQISVYFNFNVLFSQVSMEGSIVKPNVSFVLTNNHPYRKSPPPPPASTMKSKRIDSLKTRQKLKGAETIRQAVKRCHQAAKNAGIGPILAMKINRVKTILYLHPCSHSIANCSNVLEATRTQRKHHSCERGC